MGKIKVTPCQVEGKTIEGLFVIEPTVFKDERGYFVETYNQNDFKEAGLNMVFVQDNQSQCFSQGGICSIFRNYSSCIIGNLNFNRIILVGQIV